MITALVVVIVCGLAILGVFGLHFAYWLWKQRRERKKLLERLR